MAVDGVGQDLAGGNQDAEGIEGQGDGISVGRSFRDAPEIDGLVIVENTLEPGVIVPVKITGAMVHDLTGSLIETKN